MACIHPISRHLSRSGAAPVQHPWTWALPATDTTSGSACSWVSPAQAPPTERPADRDATRPMQAADPNSLVVAGLSGSVTHTAMPRRPPNHPPGRSRSRRRDLLTTAEAASELGVHPRTVLRYLAQGLIACHRLPGGHYRIPSESIAGFWRQHDRALAGRRQRTTEPAGGDDPGRPAHRRHAERGHDHRRAPRLGEPEPIVYDLSAETLAELRAELGAPDRTDRRRRR